MQFRELFVTRDVSALMEETHARAKSSGGPSGHSANGFGRGRDHRHRNLRGHR